MGDIYFYKIGCDVYGKKAARVALLLYLANQFLNMYLIKTFGNSVETILQLVLFYYYFRISNKFDRNISLVAFLAVVSFMSRCTAPIGWVFLILHTIVKKKTFLLFIKAGIFIAIPTLLLLVAIDSFIYGVFTFVPYNFYYENIVKNVSAQFGVSPATVYLFKTLPEAFYGMFLVLIAAIVFDLMQCLKKKEFPHFFVLVITFLISFSLIPHKEDRFILPVIPFLILILGNFIYHMMLLRYGKVVIALFSFALIY